MPKGRMLNKKISLDHRVATLSPVSCLIFTWLIPYQDVKGRMIAIPESIKGAVFPLLRYISIGVIKKSLVEIESAGLIVLYGNNKMYLQFNGFFKNQKINENREAPSEIPAPDELMNNSGVNHEQLCTNSEAEVEVKDKDKETRYGSHVVLTETAYTSLIEQYGKNTVADTIDSMNDWISAKGKKPFKDYAAAIRNWIRKNKQEKKVVKW